MHDSEKATKVRPLFAKYVKRHGEPGQDRKNFVDLVADLMHLSAAEGIDFDDVLVSARNHFNAES